MSQSRARLIATVLLLVCVLLAPAASAREGGNPLITLFRQEEHKGGTQTFGAERDAAGRLWFPNLDGVLIHDGAWWTRVNVESAAFEVLPAPSGEVGVGTLDGIGIIHPGAKGALEYRSLLPLLPERLRRNVAQANLCTDGAGRLLFAASTFLARWDGRALTVLTEYAAERIAPRCFDIGGRIWLGGFSGLREVNGPGIRFAGRRIDQVAGGFVIVRAEGLFRFDETAVESDASAWLRGKSVMDASPLRDGRIAVATLRDGLLLMTSDGRIDQIVDQAAGMPDELLYGVIEDHEGALWLGLDSSIVRLDASSGLTVLDSRSGVRGTPHALTRHEGALYAATTHGVYVLEESGARVLDGTIAYPWSLLSVDGELLVGMFNGISVLRGGTSVPIAGTEKVTPYAMLASQRDRSLVWLATDEGVARLRRRDGTWRYEGIVANSASYIRTLVEKDGVLWAGSQVEGVTRVAADGTATRYGSGEVHVLLAARRLVCVDTKSGFVLPVDGGKLVPDPLLGATEATKKLGHAAADSAGNIWIGARPVRMIRRLQDGTYEREARVVSAITGDVEVFFAEPDGVMWLGSDRGYYRVPAAAIARQRPPSAPLIRSVTIANDRLLTAGFAPAGAVELPYTFGRLHIEVAPLSYRAATGYQYRLDPIDGGWSGWSSAAFLDYTTLAPGDYTFRVRTRTASGAVSPETSWSFTVLPPWYATWWALILWSLLAVALVFAIVRLRTRALRRQAARLRMLVDGQTVTLRDMVEQLREAKEALVDKNALLEVSNVRLEQANERLEQLSLADPLTGVANRRSFDRALVTQFDESSRRGEPLSLILLDLDNFKLLNDTHGHAAGDECLRDVAQHLAHIVRGAGDIVARWGGEEFAVLLRGADGNTATGVAERLRSVVEHLAVTASFGVATRVATDTGPYTLVERADRALYAAKRAGRNRVHFDEVWEKDATA